MPFFPQIVPEPRRSLGGAARAAIRCARGWKARSPCCAAGTAAGRRESEPTTLASFWGEELWTLPAGAARRRQMMGGDARAERAATSSTRSTARSIGWSANGAAGACLGRGQPLPAADDAIIVQTFDDDGPSIPVPFASARWGSLASFGAHAYPGTAAGTAPAATASSRSSSSALASAPGRSPPAAKAAIPASPHFNDQAERYATGDLRPVYFYPADLAGHTERSYHPAGSR